jgi:chorismate mutase / prephenate dehydratase
MAMKKNTSKASVKKTSKTSPKKALLSSTQKATASVTPELSEVRQRIDSIDLQIQGLIADRAKMARQVGKAKGDLKAAIDYYRPEREAHVGLFGTARAAESRLSGPRRHFLAASFI